MSKKAILIGAMVACVAGSVGSIFALTRNAAAASGTSGSFDQAIYLYWDSGSSTKSISDVENLVANVPQYRYLTVAPKSTKSLTGNVTLTFTLAQTEGASYTIAGLSVKVYKTESLATDGTVAGLIEGKVAAPSLDAENLTGNTSFAVAASESAHETTAYYAIEVKYDGTNLEGKTLSGGLTISQSFGA